MMGDCVTDLRDVSRETAEAFQTYLTLLRKWSPRINLVAPASLAMAETRHVADSLQLLDSAPQDVARWVDLGSGAGFPGLVVAIAAKSARPKMHVHLVESDQRKAAFLRTVSRETQTPVTVHPQRIESLESLSSDIVSARALAPLPSLLAWVHQHMAPEGLALLPKGAGYAHELEAARGSWNFECESAPSRTQQGAVVLKIRKLSHV